MLANVALRLADFHAAGYVHRDLKPANVMWLPRENRWTVIDFGCAGKIGATVPLSFTLVYAAPEVIDALQVHPCITSYFLPPVVHGWYSTGAPDPFAFHGVL